jgi:glucose/mannose transport system permease protein
MRSKKEAWQSFLLVSPSLLAVAIFVYGFIAWTGRVSLSRWTGLLPDFTWVGLSNYVQLFGDPRFQIDIRNTVLFTAAFVSGALLLGLFEALLLDQGVKGEAFFRNLFLFPLAISYIVTGVVWRWLMNPASGTRLSGLNLLFERLGLPFLINDWYTTPFWGIVFIAIPAIWQMSGFTMAIYLAGLRAVPDELREAARVDGASEWQIYTRIVLPLLRPVTLSALIILGHMSLKVFDLILAVAGKQLALDVPAVYM